MNAVCALLAALFAYLVLSAGTPMTIEYRPDPTTCGMHEGPPDPSR